MLTGQPVPGGFSVVLVVPAKPEPSADLVAVFVEVRRGEIIPGQGGGHPDRVAYGRDFPG
jgi:hypothetical protein